MSEQNQTVSLTENQIVSKMTNNVGVMRMHKGRVRVEWPNGSVGHWWPGNNGEWCDENLARLRRFYAENIELPENSLMLADGVIVTAVVEGQVVALHFSNNPGYCFMWDPKATHDSSPALDAIKLLALRALTAVNLPRLSDGLENAQAAMKAKFIEGPPKKLGEPKPPEEVDANRKTGRTTRAAAHVAKLGGGFYVVADGPSLTRHIITIGRYPGVNVVCLSKAAEAISGIQGPVVVDHWVYELAKKDRAVAEMLGALVATGRVSIPLTAWNAHQPLAALTEVASAA